MTEENGIRRERVRHELVRRSVVVVDTARVVPSIVRITLGGEDLAGFTSPGPADHVKLFFGEEGSDTAAMRDYTPLAFRPEGAHGPELDIDFVLHQHGGPAAAWAAAAQPGDAITLGGPRGSHLVPVGVEHAALVADETALPAVSRWLDALSPAIPVTSLLFVDDESTRSYLPERDGVQHTWFTGPDRAERVAEALRSLTFNDRSFAFLAGEATTLIPLRRYLRRELGLSKAQVDAQGYWKRGTANLDHHAPLDPGDPDTD